MPFNVAGRTVEQLSARLEVTKTSLEKKPPLALAGLFVKKIQKKIMHPPPPL